MKWVCELPCEIQRELKHDAEMILRDVGYTGEELEEALERVMNEKLVNIIGYEYGELPAEKYGKYIFMEV